MRYSAATGHELFGGDNSQAHIIRLIAFTVGTSNIDQLFLLGECDSAWIHCRSR